MTGGRSASAPAKINLTLHIAGRRDDGLHLLDSIFLFTALADHVTAVGAPRFSLRVTGPRADEMKGLAPDDNLAVKAARRLAALAGVSSAAEIVLEKHIPIAAGLGGGSADAAAALKACAKLWGLEEYTVDLPALALELGADVPACLESRALRAGGVGERLLPLEDPPPWSVLLVNPRIDLPTAEVFAAYARSGRRHAVPVADMSRWRDAHWLAHNTRNDLEHAAIVLAPAIGEVLVKLRDLPNVRLARMSGSGATCFALFEDSASAAFAATRLSESHPDWWAWSGEFS